MLSNEKALALIGGRKEYVVGMSYAMENTLAPLGLDVIMGDDEGFDEGQMSFVIPYADGQRRDGVGDLLEVGGIDCERHRRNPICLFDHSKVVSLPIGMAAERNEKGAYDLAKYTNCINTLTKRATDNCFVYQGRTPVPGMDRRKNYDHALYCEQLFDMRVKGLLRSGSIGYQIKAANELPPDYGQGIPKGMHLLSTLKLESSLVVLPANMDTTSTKSLEPVLDPLNEFLCRGKCCGKQFSPYLVKGFQPYMQQRKTQLGWEPRTKSLREKYRQKSICCAQCKSDAGCNCGTKAHHQKGVTKDVSAALFKVGQELEKYTNPAPMPGYGQIFSNEGKVWYVGGDGDEDGWTEVVEQKIREAYPGVTSIICEAEGFPPKDQGWIQVFPKQREWEKALKSQPSDKVTSDKARQILKDGEANGHPLTEKQRAVFGAAAGREKYLERIAALTGQKSPTLHPDEDKYRSIMGTDISRHQKSDYGTYGTYRVLQKGDGWWIMEMRRTGKSFGPYRSKVLADQALTKMAGTWMAQQHGDIWYVVDRTAANTKPLGPFKDQIEAEKVARQMNVKKGPPTDNKAAKLEGSNTIPDTTGRERASVDPQDLLPSRKIRAADHSRVKKDLGSLRHKYRSAKGRKSTSVSTQNTVASNKSMATENTSLKSLREKYRQAKGRVRRLKKSRIGSSMVHVHSKDMDELKREAGQSGVDLQWRGTKNGVEKIRLTGSDDAIDTIARKYGRRLR